MPLILLTSIIGYVLSQKALSPSSPAPAGMTTEATVKPSGPFRTTQPLASTARKPAPPPDDAATVPAFRNWLSQYQAADEAGRAALVNEGSELAAQRRVRMARLIRENPAQALSEALRLHEYAALPDEVKAHVERPFSETAAYHYYPVCGAPAGVSDHIARLHLKDGGLDAYSYGQRQGLMSKLAVPVQGITLDDAAAIHDTALRALEPAEIATAREMFPSAQKDPTRSFVTGEPIVGAPLVALAGGELYHMADQAELKQLNDAIAELEALPGPQAGSDVLHYASPAPGGAGAPPAEDGQGFDFAAAKASSLSAASAWTLNEKRVFMIRVDFSDRAGEPFTQAATASNLNGPISDQIRAMSYGRTWIAGTVSANTYRMPQTSAHYINGPEDRNEQMLRDARNTFRANRHGADATVNIGNVSNTGTGGGSGLGDYDIVGVLFTSMQMTAGEGVNRGVYGGLAGGGDLWMQGSIDNNLFIHEFGHNYGVLHSGFWQTTDGSVTGAGNNVEYGDDYDIMGRGIAPQGHFNMQAKARLDWLSSTEWHDATALGSATYRIYRIDDQFTTGTPRGVRITRNATAGIEEYFWLGYRPAYAPLPHFERGAYMQWQRPGLIFSTLLDTTPATSGVKKDAPLALGRTFADATSNVFVTPLGIGGSGAESYLDVRVNFGPYPGNTAPVAGSISGPSTVPARTAATYSVSATDANGDTLAYYWITGDGSVADNLSSITQNWIVGGTYTLDLTVSDMKGGTHNVTKTVTVTDPLDTWTTGTVGSNVGLQDLVYGKGRFITSEAWGDDVFTSWDGDTWTRVDRLPDMDHVRFAYGADVFVAAGTRNSDSTKAHVCWSNDGRLWHSVDHLPSVPPVKAITYGNGRFLALGEDGSLLSSTDGRTWSGGLVSGAPDFRFVVWSGSGWVALSANPAGGPQIVWTSPDASGWTQRGPVAGETFKEVFKLRSFGGVCYALGWYMGVRYSTDGGVTWQDSTLPPDTRWTTLDLAQAADGTFIAPVREMDVSGWPGALLISADGIKWARASGNADVGLNAKTMVFGAGRMVSVENNGVVRRSASFYPANSNPVPNFTLAPATGSARQVTTFTASATDSNGDPLTYVWDFGPHTDMQHGGTSAMFFPFGTSQTITLRVLDGRGGVSTLTHNITVSDPARTFTNRTTTATGRFTAITSGGGRVVAVGQDSPGLFTGPYAWSTDGITWTSGTLGNNVHMAAITHDGSKFIAVGRDYDFGINAWVGKIITSPDGATWTTRFMGGKPLRAIAVGSRHVAAGESGEVVTSTDGITWSSSNIGAFAPYRFDGLSWNGSVFLLTGLTPNNGGAQAWVSSDASNWHSRSSGIGVESWQDLRKSAWLNDRFVASGWYSKLRVSTNNGDTFTTTRTNIENQEGFAYGAGVYLTVGIDKSNGDADVDVMSLDGKTWYSYPAGTTTDRYAATFFNNTFITVGDNGSIRQSDVISPANAAYSSWYATHFPGSGVASLPESDPDNDGLSNFAEYALNLPPGKSTGAVTEGTTQGGRGWIRFTLPAPARPDIRYTIEGTSTLSGTWTVIARKDGESAWTWLAGGTQRMNIGAPAGGSSIVEVGSPDGQNEGYFIRLRVLRL